MSGATSGGAPGDPAFGDPAFGDPPLRDTPGDTAPPDSAGGGAPAPTSGDCGTRVAKRAGAGGGATESCEAPHRPQKRAPLGSCSPHCRHDIAADTVARNIGATGQNLCAVGAATRQKP